MDSENQPINPPCEDKSSDKATTLTDDQRRQIVNILGLGCDRQTAVDYVGCSLGDLRREMQWNNAFCLEVRNMEARVEIIHMRKIQECATDVKHWRGSVWWLERHAPERFARGPGVVTTRQMKIVTQMLGEQLIASIEDAIERKRLFDKLIQLVEDFEQLLRDSVTMQGGSPTAGFTPLSEPDESGPDKLEDFSAPPKPDSEITD